ncbi:MAG: hypothetical protein ACXWIE_21360 [Burkholderiales bacterium]
MIEGSPSLFGVATDFGVQLAVLTVFVIVATWHRADSPRSVDHY